LPETLVVTADVSGAIGAACEIPETQTTVKAVIAMANTVRIISLLLGANLSGSITFEKRGSSTTSIQEMI
jgi:hypothetical protein